MAAIVAMVALAVTLQAQRVSGQDAIEGLVARTEAATTEGAELRARVAEAESPAEVLAKAQDMDMVTPAAVVAVPSVGADAADSATRPGGSSPVG